MRGVSKLLSRILGLVSTAQCRAGTTVSSFERFRSHPTPGPRLTPPWSFTAAPLVDALHGTDEATGPDGITDDVQIREPVQREVILAAVDDTDGDDDVVVALTGSGLEG